MFFTAVVFILLWFFQIVFLENFYEGMKISDVKRSAATIVENYGDEDYSDLLTEIAINNDLCIVITDKFNRTVYSKDVMGRNCLIHGSNNMSYDFIQKLRDSEKSSIYFKEFNSTINSDTLIMVSTIGAKDDPDGYLLINTPLVPIGSTASIIKRQLIIITFYLLVLGVIISFFMSKRIADPITRITKSAEGLAEGKYDIKFEGGDYLEIQQLAEALIFLDGGGAVSRLLLSLYGYLYELVIVVKISVKALKPVGNGAHHTLYRGFAALCLLHHADDLSEQRIATHFRRLQHKCTALVDRPGQHRSPRLLLHRQRLAGNHALIDKRIARNHRPVDRDFLPGPHADTLSGL